MFTVFRCKGNTKHGQKSSTAILKRIILTDKILWQLGDCGI